MLLTRGATSHQASSARNALKAQFHAAPRQWLERVFSSPNAPKGFGKFYPNGAAGGAKGKTAAEGAAKTAKPGGGGTGGSGGGSGGGNKKRDTPDPDFMSPATATAAATTFVCMYIALSQKRGTEISFQEFHSLLLESGEVDRIIIANKTTARVVMKDGALTNYSVLAQWRADGSSSSRPTKVEGGEPTYGDGSVVPNEVSKHARPIQLGQGKNVYAPYYFTIGSIESFERKLEEAQKSLNIPTREFLPVTYADEPDYASALIGTIPFIAFIGLALYASKKGGGMLSSMTGGRGGPGDIFKVGKSNAKKVNKEMVTTTFADVAGCDEAKKEIMEFVEFLKDSKRFTDLGAKIPKGALLCGPPGTGKTLLAKAMAGESNVPFFSISGSDFVEMFVGVGSSRVRDLFKEARANAPCIVFIDEIDAIGRQRGKGGMGGGNDERESTLNQLLVEMDGFDAATNIVVLAGTNRVDILDSALTRPGRFDRKIQVDKPDIQGRKQIFEVYLKGITLDGEPSAYSARLAALTPGFTGADIANICNEAAILAARRKKNKVDLKDFETATERIIGGLESNKLMSPEERRVVAYHEAGHAIAGWNLEHTDPLLKVTIIPRGNGALGFAQYLPNEISLRSKEQIEDMVCMALAGRASEQVNFGKVTTGAANDLQRVTQIVYQMVQVYGMNEKVGQVAFPKEEGQWPTDRVYSNHTAEVIDEEVKLIVDAMYKKTIKLMEEKKDQVILVAELLLLKETITNTDVANLVGKRPFKQSEEYEQYASSGWGTEASQIVIDPRDAYPEPPKKDDDIDDGPGVLVAPLQSRSMNPFNF